MLLIRIGILSALYLLRYSKMASELGNEQSFEMPFKLLQIELEAKLLDQNVKEI